MARVSRKNVSQAVRVPIERIYNTALYIRLSMEDSGTNSSEVIEMQKYMVEQFVNSQKDMMAYSTYIDNGYTGTNFDRPNFEKMMEDVRARKVDCIVVKDLSRFGRNYIETGYFLEKIFPFLGVRFVAITDSYDTLHNANCDEMVVSLKNLVNSIYAAFHQKQKNGEFVAGVMPYGFAKNPDSKYQLIINPETAPIVTMIFKMRLEGVGYGTIARTLSSQKTLTPMMYNYLSGKYRKSPVPTNSQVWKTETIKVILENMCYAGHTEGHKKHQSLHDSVAPRVTDKSERITVYNTHEPIISQKDFDSVQEINQKAAEKYLKKMNRHAYKENIFKGLVYCGDCNTTMTRNKNASKGRGTIRYTFICRERRVNKLTDHPCSLKSVGEPELTELILQSIRTYAQLSMNLSEKLIGKQKTKKYANEEQQIQKKIDKLQQRIDKVTLRKTVLFERFTDKTLNPTEFSTMKADYEQQSRAFEQEKQNLVVFQKDRKRTLSSKNKEI